MTMARMRGRWRVGNVFVSLEQAEQARDNHASGSAAWIGAIPPARLPFPLSRPSTLYTVPCALLSGYSGCAVVETRTDFSSLIFQRNLVTCLVRGHPQHQPPSVA